MIIRRSLRLATAASVVLVFLAAASTASADVLYGATGNSSSGELVTINATNGSFVVVGT